MQINNTLLYFTGGASVLPFWGELVELEDEVPAAAGLAQRTAGRQDEVPRLRGD